VARGSHLLSGLNEQLLPVLLRFGVWLAPALPRALGYHLADLAGDLAWLLNQPARGAVEGNLRRVRGTTPSWRAVRQVFRHGARNYYDTLIIPNLTAAALIDLVTVEGWHHLDEALRGGRGAIMAGVHLSSVALAGQVVAAKGYAVTSVVEKVDPPELHDLLVRLRSGGGVRILPLGGDIFGQLLAVLRRNEIVALVMDRDISGTGVVVDFFGAQAKLPSGPALLAMRSGAPILPVAAVRAPDGRFRGWISSPLWVEPGSGARERVRSTTQRIAGQLERFIGTFSTQWTVFQPFWSDQQPARPKVAAG
jgi:phosphatidylinositol dimannoside acyltransferase